MVPRPQLPDLERYSNNRQLRLGANGIDGSVSVFATDSNYFNGNTRDSRAASSPAQHGARRVSRTEP